jgi:lipid II:glycine glycyltransferase (peptidoglycan interpeptide bridge formation enzyme)
MADVAQLSGWARVRGHVGMRALYVLATRAGRLQGGAQILVRRIRGLGDIGYIAYGPLVFSSVSRPEALHEVLADQLLELGRTRLRMLVVQPPDGAEHSSAALLRRGFRPSRANIAPAATLRVDLEVSEDELRRKLSRRLRTWTNQWPARGVTTRVASREDLPLLADLLAKTAEHQGFSAFDRQYLTGMYEELAPTGDCVAFVGEAAGRPVAMDIWTCCGGVLKLRLVGLDRGSEAANLNVPGAIRWAAMRWARDNGCRALDFGGIRDSSLHVLARGGPVDVEALDGPDRYKARFGGTLHRYPQPVELISSPVLRTGYDVARGSEVGRRLIEVAQRSIRTGRTHVPRPRRDDEGDP